MKLASDYIIEITPRCITMVNGGIVQVTKKNAPRIYGQLETELRVMLKYHAAFSSRFVVESEKLGRLRNNFNNEQTRDRFLIQKGRTEILENILNDFNARIHMFANGMEMIRNEWKL